MKALQLMQDLDVYGQERPIIFLIKDPDFPEDDAERVDMHLMGVYPRVPGTPIDLDFEVTVATLRDAAEAAWATNEGSSVDLQEVLPDGFDQQNVVIVYEISAVLEQGDDVVIEVEAAYKCYRD
jgi:hypothetical protein